MEQQHDIAAPAPEQADARITGRAERPEEPIEELASLIESVFRIGGSGLRELAAELYRPVA